jgi:stage II sporulation protein AB (anti-sigma F factor)
MSIMHLEIASSSENEGFARVVVAAFVSRLDPTMEELSDIKTAVSEAVTNSIVHGYEQGEGTIRISCAIEGREVTVVVEDGGVGMADVEKAMKPMYTSKPELERSGMGFTFMEAFMDSLEVTSAEGEGTRVEMRKVIG